MSIKREYVDGQSIRVSISMPSSFPCSFFIWHFLYMIAGSIVRISMRNKYINLQVEQVEYKCNLSLYLYMFVIIILIIVNYKANYQNQDF